jgi:hypothetical protein
VGQPVRAAHTSEDAPQYRERAEEARQLAEKFINPHDKEVWLHVAGEWLKLAQSAEMQAKSKTALSWRPLSADDALHLDEHLFNVG